MQEIWGARRGKKDYKDGRQWRPLIHCSKNNREIGNVHFRHPSQHTHTHTQMLYIQYCIQNIVLCHTYCIFYPNWIDVVISPVVGLAVTLLIFSPSQINANNMFAMPCRRLPCFFFLDAKAPTVQQCKRAASVASFACNDHIPIEKWW